MADSIEQLSYEAAARNLERQLDALKDVRTRAGVLLAADFTAFLGRQAFAHPHSGVFPWLALASFLLAAGAVLYVLAPSRVAATVSGVRLQENLSGQQMPDAYRALTHWLEQAIEMNTHVVQQKSLATQVAAIAVVVEVVLLVAFLGV